MLPLSESERLLDKDGTTKRVALFQRDQRQNDTQRTERKLRKVRIGRIKEGWNMTEEEVQTAVAEAIKELTKQIEKQNRILESIDTAILRGMCQ